MLGVNRSCLVIFLFAAFSSGCSKPAPRFDGAYIDMSAKELQTLHSDLSQPHYIENGDGEAISVFQRPARDNIKTVQYYVRNEQVIGIVVLFSRTTGFAAVLDEVIESNGKPGKDLRVMDSRAAIWEQGRTFINITTGTSQTRVQLPTGESQTLEPGEVILVLGRR